MSTNSDLQQINVFSKGMNTDTSDAFLSSELYRYAENLRFITEDGTSNGGELRSIEDWIEETVVPVLLESEQEKEHPLYEISSSGSHINLKILATSSIRDIIVVVAKNSRKEWGIWSLRRTLNNNGSYSWYSINHFGAVDGNPNGSLCTETIGENISIVTRWESDNNIKVYIADGIHLLMSLNVSEEKHYGHETKNICGKLEINLLKLLTYVNYSTSSMIKAPVLQYAYILYKLGGQSSAVSPLTSPVVLYKTEGGYYTDEKINSTVTLELSNIDRAKADRIKVYRIGYTQNGQDPDIALIYDDGLSGNEFEYTDNGYDILTLTASEFISLTGIEFKPLLIESKNDYLFAANVEYNQSEVDKLFEGCSAYYTYQLGLEYDLDLNNNVYDYDGIKDDSCYRPTFKRGETYRFGIVFFDKKGRRSSVMKNCIGEVTIPGNSDNDYINVFDIEGSRYRAKPYDVIAHISNIPYECTGYEIVRCKRTINDTKYITQGLVGRTYYIDRIDGEPENRYAFPYLTMDNYGIYGNKDDDVNNGGNASDGFSSNDLLMFASPEYAYQPDDVRLILSSNNDLKLNVISNFKIPYTDVTGPVYYTPTVNSSLYTSRDTIILGNNDREYGEFFEISQDGYYAIPGGCLLTSASQGIPQIDTQTYPPVIESTDIESISQFINVSKLYCLLDGDSNNHTNPNHKNIEILGVGYSPEISYNRFNESDNVLIDNDKTYVNARGHQSSLNFINWDAITFYSRYGFFKQASYNPALSDLWTDTDNKKWMSFGITGGGKCLLLRTNLNSYLKDWTYRPLSIYIAEIEKTNVVPYGGPTETARQNSVFYSFGDYHLYTPPTGVIPGHSQASELLAVVTLGDCYISMFTYNSGHTYESARFRSRMYPTVYVVPVESTINLKATYGDLYTNMTSPYKYWFQDKAGKVGKLTLSKDAYLYNTIYNGSYDLMSYTPIAYTSISNDKFDCRVHYSQIKTNGEYIDSWLNFKSADFIDVDTRYGEITDLNLFKDTLVFWLNQAAGVLAVNERTMLQDVNDTNIILGNGDVLLRYDYLTTQYGMKPNQKARTQSNNALYWWDEYNKEILLYPGGNLVLPLKKVKTVSKYVNDMDTREYDRPTLSYDPKYAEVLMCIGEHGDESGNEKTLVYNEYIQLFTGLYTVPFEFSAKLTDQLNLIHNNRIYKWNGGNKNLYPKLIYIVNKASTATKVYDNVEFGMGDEFYFGSKHDGDEITDLKFDFYTPLELHSSINKNITNREYDLRFAIPRAGGKPYGDRLRGRTMLCILTTTDNNSNFSLQYIITKYRISHS